jgi:hypothetical protein
MLRWVILAVVVVLIAAGSVVLLDSTSHTTSPFSQPVGPGQAGPRPKAVIEGELTWEFGEMGQQETGRRTWKLSNEGDADLQVWKGTSTCMCTVAKLSKDGDKLILKPGESTDIEIEFQTNQTVGDFHKGANIETNDPENPTFPLFVHGKINPPVIVLPGETIDLHTIDGDDPKTGVFFALYSPDRPETRITEVVNSRPEFLKTEVEPMTESELATAQIKAGWKVNVDVKPGFPLGQMREEIVVHTDHPHRPEFKLMVVGVVSGPVSVSPERVRMVSVKSRDGGGAEILLNVRGGQEASFDVARKPEKLDVAIEPTDVKGRYRARITVPKGTPAGLVDGDVVLKTDLPNAGELKIPVSFLVGN